MPGRCFYVSWVDLRTDPWPQWEVVPPGAGETVLAGQRIRSLPADHPQWPGIPCLDQADPPVVADPRLGQFFWPGIPLQVDGQLCRLYTGPTLCALFHTGSRFCDLAELDAVYLLHGKESAAIGQARLFREILLRLAAARRIEKAEKRIRFVEIEGLADPTDHATIIGKIKEWLGHEDPFELGRRGAARTQTRIVVNLSAGTPAMHAAWLILRWNGSLGGAHSTVEFVQGDGGLSTHIAGPGAPCPLRTVPIDVLSQFIGRTGQGLGPQPSTPDEPGFPFEELVGPPFDDLRQRIDHAAMLGLPILLQGERGTGKTVLAHAYHRRRQVYRGLLPSAAKGGTAQPRKTGERFPTKAGEDNFVIVTLSEFADLDNLRDTLFGWIKGSFTGADKGFDGLLGEAHGGTLFLDEIHHLSRSLQASLLAPLNNRRYRPKMSPVEVVSHFDLVVATNDPQWRDKMADDFRDRIERIVLEVPAFRSFQRHGAELIWRFWEFTLKRRCRECSIEYSEGPGWEACRDELMGLFRHSELRGNWRDLQRLADNLLLHLTAPRDGRPSPIHWDHDGLGRAITETFAEI
jgi:hypothetical protein